LRPSSALPRLLFIPLAIALILAAFGCSQPEEEASTSPTAGAPGEASTASSQADDEPIRMYFVPSMEHGKVMTSAEEIVEALEERTGYTFEVEIPTSYIAVVEAMGAQPARADVAWLSTFAYVLAKDKYDAEIALQVGRYGQLEYRGMFVARADSGIEELAGIDGKTVAYVDPASTSGHIYPSAMLEQEGIEPSETFMAGGHPQTMMAVYTGRADVGCAYWSPPTDDGEIMDARKDIMDQHPDAGEVLQIVAYTDWIPNDTVTFRPGFPDEKREKIVQALLEYMESPAGARALEELANITELVPVEDETYDSVREKLKALGMADEETLAALIDDDEAPSEDEDEEAAEDAPATAEPATEEATETAAEPSEEEPGE
jgi:phosphonate transport system substrate-binding protein